MHLSPLRSVNRPAYPPQQVIKEHPEMLYRLPVRWLHSRHAASCAGLVAVLALVGCSLNPIQQTPSPSQTVAPSPSPLKVPFFAHGEGRGSFGCVMVAPPVYITEEEARAIIGRIAAEYGVDFPDGKALTCVDIPVTELSPPRSASPAPTMGVKSGTLELDGYSNKLNLGFEYVSVEDVKAWAARSSGATVDVYQVKDTASRLSQGLQRQDTPVAVFYDPMAPYVQEQHAFDGEQARAQLQLQVRDFFDWLKSQGII